MSSHPTILVFDSGLGGLTFYREIVKARPDADFVYVADDAFFPYSRLGDENVVARVVAVIGRQVDAFRPDLGVIACNTASTIALPMLRDRIALPFVGTVPAIKPACAASISRRVSVLGTEATVKREYTRALIRAFAAGCEVTLIGSAQLATLAEAALRGGTIDDAAIAAEIAPCFIADTLARTDTIVLACTHYPLLLDRFVQLSPWQVTFIDPAPAIARRVVELIGSAGACATRHTARVVFTSGRLPSLALSAALARFGLDHVVADRFDLTDVSA
jgi:glutamate racemase